MAVHFHKGKICFNGYLTEKDWTDIWLGPPFKYSSSCGTPCPAFLQKLCPASFFLLTHMILSPFDFDQFLLPVAGKKFSARAKSLRLPFLLSFFLSLKAGFSPMLLVPIFADFFWYFLLNSFFSPLQSKATFLSEFIFLFWQALSCQQTPSQYFQWNQLAYTNNVSPLEKAMSFSTIISFERF